MQPLWKPVWRFLKNLKVEPQYYPAVPLLGIYTEKTKNTNSKVHAPQSSWQHLRSQGMEAIEVPLK